MISGHKLTQFTIGVVLVAFLGIFFATRDRSKHLEKTTPAPEPAPLTQAEAEPVAPEEPEPVRDIVFNRDIQPLLADNCYLCHGPDSGSRKAGLRLDREEYAFAEREGPLPIVRGDPDGSLIVQRIETKDPDDLMPPPDSHKELTRDQADLVRRWIAEGAEWQEHWAFIAPVRPGVPAVGEASWVRNPIDHFILSRLERERLQPSGEADKRSLIRRVTLDLTGLPPAPEDVEAFVQDASPRAYEKVVDRLLASPRYGEHRARYWLDAARYGDTHGLHLDNLRIIWPYRDWVIQAFNANMPFDQFTIEQLAGDLLPEPSLEQRIATGFNRCNVTTSEGGAIDAEFYARYAVDRVETTASVWMGLTSGCAACHDHKFDPLSQKEFYRLYAFFNNTTQKAMDGNKQDTPPVVVVPVEEDRSRFLELTERVKEINTAISKREAESKGELEQWMQQPTLSNENLNKNILVHLGFDEGKGSNVTERTSGKTFDVSGNASWEKPAKGGGFDFDGSSYVALPDQGGVEGSEAFSYGALVRPAGDKGAGVIAKMDTQNNFRGYDLYTAKDQVMVHILHQWPTNGIKVTAKKKLKLNAWQHLFVTYDGSQKAKGVKIYVDGELQAVSVNLDSLSGSIRTETPFMVGTRDARKDFTENTVRDVRLYRGVVPPAKVKLVADASHIAPVLALDPGKRGKPQREKLKQYFFSRVDGASKDLRVQRAKTDKEVDGIRKRGTITLVMEEKKDEPFAFVLERGEYDRPGDKVFPGVPDVLPPLPENAPSNRLGLARWLVHPDHPLTARVAVNRFWQELFGAGIVKTPEDFGLQGKRPSHPKLLDWLAVEFRERGWDMKAMYKLMVMSATYRQDARLSSALLDRDPENILLARGPRFRLDAEVIRDQALAAGGLLVEKIGGVGVKPYQPAGIWQAVGYPKSNTVRYQQDKGEGLFRRSIYTFWKRTAPPPSLQVFNAPSREGCTVRRERTNTPLQALVLMNDIQFVEAARHLAQRAITSPGDDADARLDFMSGRVLSRPLEDDDREILREALARFTQKYQEAPEAAGALIAVGDTEPDPSIQPVELAAWTMVASQVLNLDEALNK